MQCNEMIGQSNGEPRGQNIMTGDKAKPGTRPPDRDEIQKGLRVMIVLKQDQRSGKLTQGIVQDILTKSATHPHGIKVRLASGEVGRVKAVIR